MSYSTLHRSVLGLFLAVFVTFFCSVPVLCAAAAGPVAPVSVRLSPTGGLLSVQQQAEVLQDSQGSAIRIVLPAGAQNWQVHVPGHRILRWSSTPQVLEQSGTVSAMRASKLHELEKCKGQLAAVNAQLKLWKTHTESSSYDDVIQFEKRMAEVLPALSAQKSELERQIALLQKELKMLPASPELGQAITLHLGQKVTAATLPVEYSYTLTKCGWRPVYIFDAQPDRAGGDETDVRLMAEAWQFSGMDWHGAKLTLVSQEESRLRLLPCHHGFLKPGKLCA